MVFENSRQMVLFLRIFLGFDMHDKVGKSKSLCYITMTRETNEIKGVS